MPLNRILANETEGIVEYYLNLGVEIESGVYIEQIFENSLCVEVLNSGDIIRAIDNEKITRMQQLTEYLYTKNPGDTVTLNIIRGTEEIEQEIVLNEK